MCTPRQLSIAALVTLAVALVAARPQRNVPRMDLADVIGRSVCPLKVEVNNDPLRLPRRIKYLSCDRDAAQACPAAVASAGACCHGRSRHRDYITQCVEVFDNVVVQFLSAPGADPRNATQHVLQVPVGCACVVQTGTPAREED